MTNSKVREPLFHITKRDNITTKKSILIRVIAVFFSLLLLCVVCAIVGGEGIDVVLGALFDGAFGSERKIWITLQDTALLLGVSLALIPAFKMKFWNLGGNGQILISCLMAVVCMKFFGGKIPDWSVWILMAVLCIAAGAVWALIPAIFKAIFNTNESLFTLMLNYVAQFLVGYFVVTWSTSGSNVLTPFDQGTLPVLGNQYLLTILVIVISTVVMTIYLGKSKQGYELSVVGESQNTAKYVGINVKKVIIRTMAISGAMCGIVGLLLAGAIEHTMSESIAKNMGFTAIMATWLGHCNPIMVILTSFLITFLNRGMVSVRMELNLTSDAIGNVCIALAYFIIIASEFFITYKVKSPIFDKIAALIPKRKKIVKEVSEQEVVNEQSTQETSTKADDLVVESATDQTNATDAQSDDKQEGGEQ
ncbi:MAG: ABC transporter permease [Eubacteriales bacterium]|nr:ABC transporter permease [Eubacteriales bacterium]